MPMTTTPTLTPRERILATLAGRPIDRLAFMPITMMFAADLAGVGYRDYVTDHRALVEAQIRTAEAYDIDYVSAISDPAREAADCGAALVYFDDQPPAIREETPLLANTADLATLKSPDPHAGGRMTDRLRAVALFRQRVGRDRLIEGWVEGPCAAGADLRGLNPLMYDFMDDEPFVRDLFEFVLAMETRFALAQVEAGADLIGIGDAAASLVGPQIYRDFVLPFERRLVAAIHAAGAKVRLHICGNTQPLLADIGTLGCDIVDLDYPASVADARAAMGPRQVLLGNLDPVRAITDSNPQAIRAALAAAHRAAGHAAFIVGAGCEIPRGTPPENLRAMAAYARDPAAPPA